MFETDLLTQLQTIHYTEGDNMCTHLTKMSEIRDCLAEIGAPITDASFNSYIWTSLSLTYRYQPLFTALNTTSHETRRLIMSASLIWHLNKEANNTAIEANINQVNAAMIAAHSRVSGSTSGGSGGKGKDKEKSKSGNGRKYTNCKRKGHIKETCFAKRGGKEHDVPDWWKEKLVKEKKEPEKSANMASKDSQQDDNYTLLTIPTVNASHTEDAEDANFALVVASRHDHQAHAVASSVGIIIDCGASSYFSLDRSKFLDYKDIDPEPTKAADGCSFSAISKGDIRVTLPACNDIQPITICPKGVYYAPAMAFTLISISCLDCAGCLLLMCCPPYPEAVPY